MRRDPNLGRGSLSSTTLLFGFGLQGHCTGVLEVKDAGFVKDGMAALTSFLKSGIVLGGGVAVPEEDDVIEMVVAKRIGRFRCALAPSESLSAPFVIRLSLILRVPRL